MSARTSTASSQGVFSGRLVEMAMDADAATLVHGTMLAKARGPLTPWCARGDENAHSSGQRTARFAASRRHKQRHGKLCQDVGNRQQALALPLERVKDLPGEHVAKPQRLRCPWQAQDRSLPDPFSDRQPPRVLEKGVEKPGHA